MHLTIRAEGGPDIGYGHLVRSGAVAEELLNRGHDVTYATTTPDAVEDVCPPDVRTFSLPTRSDSVPFLDRVDESTDAILVDCYAVDSTYQRAIRNVAPIALMTDDARHSVCADLVVNGNLHAPSLKYDIVGEEPTWCLGPEYLVLRKAIRRLAPEDPPWRDQVERAIVTMGGSDTANLTPTVLQAFDGTDLRVDAIAGPGFTTEQRKETESAATGVSPNVCVVHDPDNLAERMFQSDFAVATASTTTYELLALGTPIITVPVVDNQEPIATALRKCDAATVIERRSDPAAFRNAIRQYTTDASLRRERRSLGRELIDGQGTERVCTELFSLAD
jgi:UDP-2,4-diacetamido-2,4,6-trideoxy-beta-L-altropyranose hydrolase